MPLIAFASAVDRGWISTLSRRERVRSGIPYPLLMADTRHCKPGE
jgi:hypothetical protein